MASPYARPDNPVETVSYNCFKGKVVLITGSSSGIGAATAVAYVKNGAKVALHGRNVERLQNVRDFCIKEGGTADQIFCVSGDLNDDKATEKVVNDTVKHFGKLDILINNAGAIKMMSFKSSSPEQLDDMYRTNTRAVYHVTHLALPHLIKTKGNIIMISSIGGIIASDVNVNYGMAKAMVNMLAQSLSLELARDGVRVNIVSPGGVKTPIFTHSQDQSLSKEDIKKRDEAMWDSISNVHPLGRNGWPDEIAQSILFLSSDVASFVTGLNYMIDGGFSAGRVSNSFGSTKLPIKEEKK